MSKSDPLYDLAFKLYNELDSQYAFNYEDVDWTQMESWGVQILNQIRFQRIKNKPGLKFKLGVDFKGITDRYIDRDSKIETETEFRERSNLPPLAKGDLESDFRGFGTYERVEETTDTCGAESVNGVVADREVNPAGFTDHERSES